MKKLTPNGDSIDTSPWIWKLAVECAWNARLTIGLCYAVYLFIRLRNRKTLLTEEHYGLYLQTLTNFDLCLIVEPTITIVEKIFGESQIAIEINTK